MENNQTDISVVIVSYKCLSVLRMALVAIRNAANGVDADIYVVDNASGDGTVEYLKNNFSWVNVIENKENVGFSRANNQALSQCRGRVVLVLNPDTIIPRSFLRAVVDHFDNANGKGALGVQMTDGTGTYLKESKRGYPGISASFCKLTGLWRLAPQSARLNAYYVGQYGKNDVCRAPILSGACMAFSHTLMQQAGVFDESYFMYGEDIDLSWRYNLASDGNDYRGDMQIVHFKGISTPRRLRYIRYFYNAMVKFARHYESPKHFILTNMFVRIGIFFGYMFASVKCLILKMSDCFHHSRTLKRVALATADIKSAEAFAAGCGPAVAVDTVSLDTLSKLNLYSAVVFDVDADIEAVIDFMKKNRKSVPFGFYSRTEQFAFVYENNDCRVIFDKNKTIA
ncbi:MAG: glycosyltransferase family 2 protein [Bacteroidales bacterium]|nr:glycosyltransferase family 2 protein [Bacteroidales bacterium]